MGAFLYLQPQYLKCSQVYTLRDYIFYMIEFYISFSQIFVEQNMHTALYTFPSWYTAHFTAFVPWGGGSFHTQVYPQWWSFWPALCTSSLCTSYLCTSSFFTSYLCTCSSRTTNLYTSYCAALTFAPLTCATMLDVLQSKYAVCFLVWQFWIDSPIPGTSQKFDQFPPRRRHLYTGVNIWQRVGHVCLIR